MIFQPLKVPPKLLSLSSPILIVETYPRPSRIAFDGPPVQLSGLVKPLSASDELLLAVLLSVVGLTDGSPALHKVEG